MHLPYYIKVIVAFVLLMTGFLGKLDAWLYWWIAMRPNSYTEKELLVASIETIRSKGHDRYAIRGSVDQTAVSMFTDELVNEQGGNIQTGSRFKVLWNGNTHGQVIQDRSANIVQLHFIQHPPSRVWWGPLASLSGMALLILALMSRKRPPARLHLPFIIDRDV